MRRLSAKARATLKAEVSRRRKAQAGQRVQMLARARRNGDEIMVRFLEQG